jgi:hypothetical protein
MTNIAILSLFHAFVSSECEINHGNMPLFPSPCGILDSLALTALQKSTPHEPWIDLFPHGRVRDNMIKAAHIVDKDDICHDLVGGVFEGSNSSEVGGVLVWSDLWHIRGWELTPNFIHKWAFLLKGCNDVIEATNRWRATRDEEPLAIEL